MNVSHRSTSHILHTDLQLDAYQRCVCDHLQTPRLKEMHLQRFKNKGHRCIVSSNEKILNTEDKFNQQNENDLVNAMSCYEANEKAPRVTETHHPPI